MVDSPTEIIDILNLITPLNQVKVVHKGDIVYHKTDTVFEKVEVKDIPGQKIICVNKKSKAKETIDLSQLVDEKFKKLNVVPLSGTVVYKIAYNFIEVKNNEYTEKG